ncbi:archaea-specific SMC-related protein [Haloferax namakaokahaiae]|uniref:Archaea-specific SMC-related protein n=1 Tax=Haloferax namakaokahaiae TaxID=1748331 RepID=A0ABD5ZJP5_9EURY
MTLTKSASEVSVEAQNIGGIEHASVAFEPGITILVGRNATNRTSFLQALMAALGSDRASLKADADEGSVTLSVNDETYTRTLRREGSNVVTDGAPYLDDPTLPDLFAFLLESNEVRRAVERGDDLRELIMRPVDTTAIESKITQLEAERRSVSQRLKEADNIEQSIHSLEQREAELEAKIEDAREQCEELEAKIEAEEAAESRSGDELFERLSDLRSSLENVRFRLETERQSLEALTDDESDIREALDELPDESHDSPEDLESELSKRRERVRQIESQMNELQNIIRVNESMLSGTNRDIANVLRGEEERDVTKGLLEDEQIVCWTCGSEVDADTIEATIDNLQSYRADLASERRNARQAIDDLADRLDTIESRQGRRRQLNTRLEQTIAEREETTERIDDLEARQEELHEEIAAAEEEVEDVDDERDELVELHSQANRAELERDRLETERERVRERLDEARMRKDELAELRARREEIDDEIQELRGRIDRIEANAVEAFNDHMERVLDILDYGNVERVWIERIQRESRGRSDDTREFVLHIVRETETGTVYEDTIDHLSESEREVIGLVFALAGYLVHDVADQLPFLLLDSLEAIDSQRISALVEYIHEHAEFVVVALLPEDAAALDDEHARVTEI